MAWAAFLLFSGAFIAILIALLVAIFVYNSSWQTQTILAGFDTILGYPILRIYGYLFPVSGRKK